ncbi:MAG: hypothetical protein IJJ99_04700 [Oscillospiraceae bacterium]|nr:hypothetical protein [Oscillospiraceae bacterium]
MKKLALLLCLVLLLTACQTPAAVPDGSSDTESTNDSTSESTELPTEESAEVPTEASTEPTQDEDVPVSIRQNLPEVFSYHLEEMYMNLAQDGFSQTIDQETALDGSFHFTLYQRQWDHTAEFADETLRDFYYQQEDGVMVCYARLNGEAPERIPMTKAEEADLSASMELVVGASALLPDYLKDFKDEGIDSESGLRRCTYRMSVQDILHDETMLASFVYLVCAVSGYTYQATDDLYVTAALYLDDAMRPVKLTHDFSELKPFVLSEGAVSGEYAMQTDLVYLTYEFDYDTPETISVPENFLP